MKKFLYLAGLFSLALAACSDDGVSGTSDNSENSAKEAESSVSEQELLYSSSSENVLSSGVILNDDSFEESSAVSSSNDIASSDSLISSESLSSTELESSSSTYQALCKAVGGWGCIITGHGDLWGLGLDYVLTNAFADDSSDFGNHFGEFFYEMGSEDGANTTVVWDDGLRISEFGNGRLSANVFLDKGKMDSKPFFNLGFNIAGYDSNGVALFADISNWNGICVVLGYGTSDGGGKLSLQLDYVNLDYGKNNDLFLSAPLKITDSTQCVGWNDFKAIESENSTISGENAAKYAKRIIFHFQSLLEIDTLAFDILAIGTNRDE